MTPNQTLAVHLAPGATDLRKSINGLSILVESHLPQAVVSGSLFVFCNRRRDLIKVLYWDRNGFCVWMKRLEKERFHWPESDQETVCIDRRALDCPGRLELGSRPSPLSVGLPTSVLTDKRSQWSFRMILFTFNLYQCLIILMKHEIDYSHLNLQDHQTVTTLLRQKDYEIERLQELVAYLQNKRFGSSSEQLRKCL